MILYEGPSLLEPGTDIVVVATEDSNPKTGRMLMTWILRQDRPPEVAAYDGSDSAICGDCKFRALNIHSDMPHTKASRTCYVRLGDDADEAMPPSEVWRKWKAGEFPRYEADGFCPMWTHERGSLAYAYTGPLPVRIGSYGDPAAVPTRVWAELVRYAKNWTGYTHMWRNNATRTDTLRGQHSGLDSDGSGFSTRSFTCDPDLKRYCMASVDSPEEREEAQALGWRTFMVVPENPYVRIDSSYKWGAEDILCPATDETKGKVCPTCKGEGEVATFATEDTCSKCEGVGRVPVTCATCLLCRGTSAPAPSIWEVVHSKNASNHKW